METKETKVEMTDKMKSIMQTIESMTVMELADLVKALEDKFGVQAAAAVSVQALVGAGGGPAQGPVEEKTTFTVVLTSAGTNKIQVIKELRVLTSLGLKEAKDLVDGAPKTVKDGATKEEAEKIKKALEGAGGKVELK
jgi:large subunit ribosomal protein L7/L12